MANRMLPLIIPLISSLIFSIPGGKEKMDQIFLNGHWDFIVDPQGAFNLQDLDNIREWRKIKVPGCWQGEFEDLLDYNGTAWYRRRFLIPKDWLSQVILLKFSAVDYYCDIWINQKSVGSHEGGYTPFQFEIQDYVCEGENELVLKVIDSNDDPAKYPDFPFGEIPHGKQEWYSQVSGIWQDVYLVTKPKAYFESLFVTPDIEASKATLKATLAHPPNEGFIQFVVISPEGKEVAKGSAKTEPGKLEYEAQLFIPQKKLWSPENPRLYQAVAKIPGGDSISTTFGMRKIEAKNNLIYLNNQPIYLIGALDQDFYPKTIYTPPSDEFIKDQFIKAKELGLNLLRCHIKAPDPKYLYWADRLGLLIWYEIPHWNRLTEKAKERAKETVTEMIKRDYNHPSLVIISLINEGWGIDLSQKEHRLWLKEMYEHVKNLDPTRLVVDNSACGGNFHIKSDINDFHGYFSIPDHYLQFAEWIKEFSSGPDWTFSPYGDGERKGTEPLVLSEFGNWGLPKISNLEKVYGKEPWWFKTGSHGSTRPEGVRERFHHLGLQKVFRNYDEFAQATQRHQFESLKYEIEQLRKHKSIVGYVITEFTDLHWECNGLLDFCRNPKVYHKEMQLVQAQDVVIPDWKKLNYWSGETLKIDVWVSHFSNGEIKNCHIDWELEGFNLKGSLKDISVGLAEAKKVGEIEFTVPELSRASKTKLHLNLKDKKGNTIARNYLQVNLFPRSLKRPKKIAKIWLYDPRKTLENFKGKLQELGYRIISEQPSDIDCIITNRIDQGLIDYLSRGEKVLLLAQSPSSLPFPFKEVKVVDRGHKGRWGDWCTCFCWAQGHPVFDNIPIEENICGFEFYKVTPSYVLEGFESADSEDILSGLFVGWLNSSAVLTGQFKAGEGKILATTFELTDSFFEDPAATILLNNMIAYCLSGEFKPKKEISLRNLKETKVFLPTGEQEGQIWRYTTSQPPAGWQNPEFDDSDWQEGLSGFGRVGTPNTFVRTDWHSPDIWLRYKGKMEKPPAKALLRYYHDEDMEIYINGKLILSKKGYIVNYEGYLLSPTDLALLKPGETTIAIHCHQTVGGQYIDVGLYYLE